MRNLTYIESIPDYFFDLNQDNVLEYLDEMTLFFHRGESDKTILLSTMLHGNETSGLKAIQQYLKSVIDNQINDFSFLILLGNPKAFSQNKRLVEGQLDRNRIWQIRGDHPDHSLAKGVIDKVIEFSLIYAVDIHNNTGKNPYFCCVNRLDQSTLGLASFFGADALFFEDPSNAFTTFMGRFCPSVTLECGVSGDELGVQKAVKFLDKATKEIGCRPFADLKFNQNIFKSIGKFKVRPETNINFIPRENSSQNNSSLVNGAFFYNDLESFNLKLLKGGTKLGEILGPIDQIEVVGEFGEQLFDDFFVLDGNDLISKNDFYVAMVTKNVAVAKSDCFFYILKKLSLS